MLLSPDFRWGKLPTLGKRTGVLLGASRVRTGLGALLALPIVGCSPAYQVMAVPPPTGLQLEICSALEPDDGQAPECLEQLPETWRFENSLPQASRYNAVVIRATRDGSPVTMGSAGVDSVILLPDDTLVLAAAEKNQTYFAFPLRSHLASAPHGKIDTVEVRHGETSTQGVFRVRDALRLSACLRASAGSDCSDDVPATPRLGVPAAGPSDEVVISFREDQTDVRLGEAGFRKLEVLVDEEEVDVPDIRDADRDLAEYPIQLRTLGNLEHGTSVQLVVHYRDRVERRLIKIQRDLGLYGRGGWWIPMGMFATNFSSPDTAAAGVPFSPLPLGLAWGGKKYVGSDRNSYLGLSLTAGWQLLPGKNEAGEPDGSQNLQALTVGLLGDVLDFVNLGAAYSFNFAKKGEEGHPGAVLVVGAGPALIRLFKLLNSEN